MAKTKKSTGQPSSNKRAKHEEPTLTEDEKRVVMIQFNKENEADTKTADALLKEYLKFMQIKIAEHGSNAPIKAAPSRKVDELWHAHILSTKEYAQFCERHNNGNFIHHDPSIPDSPDRYQQTWIKYEEFFKSQPPPEIWPFPEVEEDDILMRGDAGILAADRVCIDATGRKY